MARLASMGLRSSCPESPGDDWLSSAELFPWWLQGALSCVRLGGSMAHLGKLLVARRHGLSQGASRHRLNWQAFASGISVGTPAQVASMLLDQILECLGDQDEGRSNRVATAAILGLDSLRRRRSWVPAAGSGDPGPAIEGCFVRAVQALMTGPSRLAAAKLGACRLVARDPIPELAEAIGGLVRSHDTTLVLAAAACLVRLGEPGSRILEAWPAGAPASTMPLVGVILDAWKVQDLDGLDPYLNSASEWLVRNSAARFVTDLADVGCRPEAALEILLARLRVEEDRDNLATLAECLGEVLVPCGAEGSRKVVTVINELGEAWQSWHLLNGLMFSGCAGLGPGEIEALRTMVGTRERPRWGELNRCLAWHGGIPVSLMNWISEIVIKALQWGRPHLPAAVVNWFALVPAIEAHQVTAAVVRKASVVHAGALAAAFLTGHPEVIPVWQELVCLHLNRGTDDVWAVLSSVLAGSLHGVDLHPAELRAAIGSDCSPPLPFSWAAVGRLVAVAASPVAHAKEAIRLLSALGPAACELATHALATVPTGGERPSGMAAMPPVHALGPGRALGGMIGMPVARRPVPSVFPAAYQPMFSILPAAWQGGSKVVEGLRIAALHCADWGAELIRWHDQEEARGAVEGLPVEVVQQALVACGMSGREPLLGLLLPLAAALGPECRQGGLGAVVGVMLDRAEADRRRKGSGRGGVRRNAHTARPPGVSVPSCPDDDDTETQELNELIFGLEEID